MWVSQLLQRHALYDVLLPLSLKGSSYASLEHCPSDGVLDFFNMIVLRLVLSLMKLL